MGEIINASWSIWWVDDHWVRTSRMSMRARLLSSSTWSILQSNISTSLSHAWWCWGDDHVAQTIFWSCKLTSATHLHKHQLRTHLLRNGQHFPVCCLSLSSSVISSSPSSTSSSSFRSTALLLSSWSSCTATACWYVSFVDPFFFFFLSSGHVPIVFRSFLLD